MIMKAAGGSGGFSSQLNNDSNVLALQKQLQELDMTEAVAEIFSPKVTPVDPLEAKKLVKEQAGALRREEEHKKMVESALEKLRVEREVRAKAVSAPTPDARTNGQAKGPAGRPPAQPAARREEPVKPAAARQPQPQPSQQASDRRQPSVANLAPNVAAAKEREGVPAVREGGLGWDRRGAPQHKEASPSAEGDPRRRERRQTYDEKRQDELREREDRRREDVRLEARAREDAREREEERQREEAAARERIEALRAAQAEAAAKRDQQREKERARQREEIDQLKRDKLELDRLAMERDRVREERRAEEKRKLDEQRRKQEQEKEQQRKLEQDRLEAANRSRPRRSITSTDYPGSKEISVLDDYDAPRQRNNSKGKESSMDSELLSARLAEAAGTSRLHKYGAGAAASAGPSAEGTQQKRMSVASQDSEGSDDDEMFVSRPQQSMDLQTEDDDLHQREEQLQAELTIATLRCQELKRTLHETKSFVCHMSSVRDDRSGLPKPMKPTINTIESAVDSDVDDYEDDADFEESYNEDYEEPPTQRSSYSEAPQPKGSGKSSGAGDKSSTRDVTPRKFAGAPLRVDKDQYRDLHDPPTPTGRLGDRIERLRQKCVEALGMDAFTEAYSFLRQFEESHSEGRGGYDDDAEEDKKYQMRAILGEGKAHYTSLIEQLLFMEETHHV